MAEIKNDKLLILNHPQNLKKLATFSKCNASSSTCAVCDIAPLIIPMLQFYRQMEKGRKTLKEKLLMTMTWRFSFKFYIHTDIFCCPWKLNIKQLKMYNCARVAGSFTSSSDWKLDLALVTLYHGLSIVNGNSILCTENISCVAAPQHRILAPAREGDCAVTSRNGRFNLKIRKCH